MMRAALCLLPALVAVWGALSASTTFSRVETAPAAAALNGTTVAQHKVAAQRGATPAHDTPPTEVDDQTMTPGRSVVPATVSVGEFLLRWARLLDPELPEGAGVVAVAAALAEQGNLGDDVDLDRPVTEGDVVGFIAQIGYRWTTLHADRPLPPASIEAFFDRFGQFVSGEHGAGLVFSRAACEPEAPSVAGVDGRAGGDLSGTTTKPSLRP